MKTTLTIANTPDEAMCMVTLHLPMNDGQQILLSLLQPKGQDSLARIQARLLRDVRGVLDLLDPPVAP